MTKTKAAWSRCSDYHAKNSLIPSDTHILAQNAAGGILCALVMVGVPFVMALLKSWGVY